MNFTPQRRALLTGLVALALAGCAARPDLSRIQDPNADFHAYRTFAFLPMRADGSTSLVERRLLSATRKQLESRGYVFDELAPDLLVNLAAVIEERQGLRAVPGGFPGRDAVETEDYRLGRLAIDVYDAHRQDVIWHGTAEGRVNPEMLRDVGAGADKAVSEVFKGFPIKPRKHALVSPTSASR